MRRSVPYRLVAFVFGLLVSLTAPALAVTHGLAHDHLAHAHGEHEEHEEHVAETTVAPSAGHALDADLAPTLAPAGHGHEHGHATIDVAPGPRDLARLTVAVAAPTTVEPPPTLARLVVVRSPALEDHALLARPDPESGPPPRLRAPPVR